MRNSIFALVLMSMTYTSTQAQDAHFSQFNATPMTNNPAMTGMFDHSDFRMSTNFRSQWGSLTNNFMTSGFAFDMPTNERFGAGMYMLNYDMAGAVNSFSLGASGAYNIADKSADYMLTVGLQAGIIYKKINDNDLIFDNQYSDGFFDSDLPTGENFEKGGKLMPDVSLGIGFKSTDRNKTVNPFANFAAFHLTTPNEAIISPVESDLPIRWSANVGALIEVNDEFFVKPSGMFQMQGNAREIVMNVLCDYELDGTAYNAVFGAGMRMKDAIIAHLGIKHRSNVYRLSYDLNTSPLQEFTNKRGALEFSIQYYGTHNGRTSKRGKGARF